MKAHPWKQGPVEPNVQRGATRLRHTAARRERPASETGLYTNTHPPTQPVVVRSAVSLTALERARLEALLARRFPGAGSFRYELDPSLLGGIWLRVGDRVIDGSLSGRLRDLQSVMRDS